MKTRWDYLRDVAPLGNSPLVAVVRAVYLGLIHDSERLAAIDAVRAKGGLTEGSREIYTLSSNGFARQGLALDDALRSATEELARCRAMLADLASVLVDAGLTICALGDGSVATDQESPLCKATSDTIRAYLAETEAR